MRAPNEVAKLRIVTMAAQTAGVFVSGVEHYPVKTTFSKRVDPRQIKGLVREQDGHQARGRGFGSCTRGRPRASQVGLALPERKLGGLAYGVA